MPVTVEETPGVMVPALLEVRAPVIDPVPKSEPPFRLTPPEEDDSDPLYVVMPPDWLNIPEPPNENVLPVLMVKVPALAKFPAVVNERFPARAKVPLLVAKFARPLALDWSIILEAAPVSVMLAALVTMLAPLNCSVPVTLYVPPVSVVPEKLIRLPFTSNLLLLLPTVSVPLLVKLPTVVKLKPPLMANVPLLVARFVRPTAAPVWSSIFAVAPDMVTLVLAAIVWILAPANCNVPLSM